MSTREAPAAEMPASPWRIVAVAWLGMVLNYVDRQVAFSIFPVLRSDLGFSESQLGLVGLVFIWTYSLLNPFAGRLADVWRREHLLAVSMALWSLATLGTAASRSPLEFLVWRGVMGATEAAYAPAAVSLIATAHAGSTRSRAIALYATGQMVGIVAGGWFGGWMATGPGWRVGYVMLGMVGLLFAPVFYRLLGRVPAVAAADAPRQGAATGGVSRCFLAHCVAFFMLCAMLWIVYSWLPDLLFRRFDFSLAKAGLLATVCGQTGSIAGLFAGGWLADRIVRSIRPGRFYVSAVGLALAAPCIAVIFSATQFPVLAAATFGFGFFASLFSANVFAAAYDVIPASRYGVGGGILNMLGGLGGGLAMFAVGYLGSDRSVQACVGGAVAAAILMAVVARRQFSADRSRAGLGA
ncbi:MAG: MFS transporter [Planctomycetia bacterium]